MKVTNVKIRKSLSVFHNPKKLTVGDIDAGIFKVTKVKIELL